MRARRTFTNEFKREVVELVVSGKVSQLEISRKYNISPEHIKTYVYIKISYKKKSIIKL